MSSRETKAQRSPHGVATPPSGLLDSGPCCLQCGQAIPSPRNGQRACSARCRWALWKAGQQAAARERDRKILEHVMSAEESLQEIRTLIGDGQ